MKKITQHDISIPLTVPLEKRATFIKNYLQATRNSGNFFLFSGDQKIEHLNDDFYGEGIAPENANPRHLFEIASKAPVGAFAAQLGLIAHWGAEYSNIPYVIKCNSKTNILSVKEEDPKSLFLQPLDTVFKFIETSKLNVIGLGYTVYLGSEHEPEMLAQAGELVARAHEKGLLTILWMYPRGEAVKDELAATIIAGAAGVGACLGADFIKVNPPRANTTLESATLLQQASDAAGKTKVLCSGGKRKNDKEFLKEIYEQLHTGKACGNAIGRNIHQRPLGQAIALCKAIEAIVCKAQNLDEALKLL